MIDLMSVLMVGSLLNLLVASLVLGFSLTRYRDHYPLVGKLALLAFCLAFSCVSALISFALGRLLLVRVIGAIVVSVPVWYLARFFRGSVNGRHRGGDG